jgi:tetratricopeptide (TPR) repeat protein
LYVLLGEEADAASKAVGLAELALGESDTTNQLSFYVHDVLPSGVTFLSTFVIGHLYYLSNDYTEGHRAFDVAMENIPEGVDLRNEALLHFFRARLMHTAPYTDPAIITCEYARAIELDPELFEAYNNLGVLMMHRLPYIEETYQDREKLCAQAAGISSLDPRHLFAQALEIHPDWALPRYNLAAIDWSVMLGDVQASRERARAECQAVIELDPTIPGAHVVIGNMSMWEEEFDAAVHHFRAALDGWPESAQVTVNLGQALALAGQDEEAIASYERALALAPDNTWLQLEAYLAMGTVYQRQGDLSRAYEAYQQAEQLPLGYVSEAGKYVHQIPDVLYQAITSYEISAGEWASATKRLLPVCDRPITLSPYLCWLVGTIQGEADAYQHKPPVYGSSSYYQYEAWYQDETARLTWYDLMERCNGAQGDDVATWGSQANPCLPADLGERLEAVYAQFHRRIHYRLFYNGLTQLPGGIGACPYVYTYDEQHGEWLPDTTILYELVGPEAERLQARQLERFDGRLWLRELEPETSYVDQLAVRVLTADERWLTLTPDDPALASDDGDYIILYQGDERLLVFDLPSGALPFQQAWVVAEGYYVPYGKEE